MQTVAQRAALTPLPAPRWSWRSVCLAAAMTLGIYILIPWLEQLSAPPELDTDLRSIQTTRLPPPAAPAPPEPARRHEPHPEPPKPQLKEIRQRLIPLQAGMNLNMALSNLDGDFSMNFGMQSDMLTQQIQTLIFDLGELDEPPRPLVRLQPVYPPQARIRQLEGEVTVEFIVQPDGNVEQITVLTSTPGELFVPAAVRAVQRWRFQPGIKDGTAVASRVRQNIRFTLETSP